MNFRLSLEYLSTISAQIVMLVLSSALVIYFLHKPVTEFHAVGQESFVMKVTPDVINKWGKEPTHVKTGFMIHEFLQFDTIKNNFLMNAVVSFEFDPNKVGQDKLDKFSFTKGDIVTKSDPIIKKISDNLTFMQYYVRIQFSTLFDYSMFPLDDHKIFLNLTNNSLEAENVIFDVSPENFSVPKYVFLSGWNIESYSVKSGYTEFVSQENMPFRHPKIVFAIDIKKQDFRQLFLIFLPLFVLFYTSIFILAVKDLSIDLDSILFVITAYTANVIVVQAMSPDVGYFMFLDYFILFFLIVMFIVFVVTFIGTLPEDTISTRLLPYIRGGSVIIIYIALIALTYYLTHAYKLAA
ncbi:MAG: hypothetical protein P4L31_04215 [Candidatus Babeliales bacterium]|nr:hypothetical protein [Candidatus Babeliales bacterium]